jgi:hypothetical protein
MAAPSPQDVTRLLKAWNNGEQAALEQLMPLVHNELHRSAQLMRHILMDHARSRSYSKRGGEWRQVPLNEAVWLCFRIGGFYT